MSARQTNKLFPRIVVGLFCLALGSAPTAFASAPRDATCDALVTNAWSQVTGAEAAYSHAKVGYFNKMFRLLNSAFPAGVESIFCHFQNSLGITPAVDTLPLSATRTWDGLTVTLGMSAPSDSFSTALGYTVAAALNYNSTNVLNFFWGGQGESTKGFLIAGKGNFSGANRPMYVQWDRSGTTQTLKVLGTEFQSSFLANAAASGGNRGDRIAYGSLSYTPGSQQLAIEVTVIEEQHSGGTAGQFGCFKLAATGTKGGVMQIAYTRDSLSGSGHSLASSSIDSTDLEGLLIQDSTTTASGCESSPSATCRPLTNPELVSLGVFTKSCAEINTAGSAPGHFSSAGNNANLSAIPSEIFE